MPIRQIYERWVSEYAEHWATTLISVKESVEDKQKGSRPRKSARNKN